MAGQTVTFGLDEEEENDRRKTAENTMCSSLLVHLTDGTRTISKDDIRACARSCPYFAHVLEDQLQEIDISEMGGSQESFHLVLQALVCQQVPSLTSRTDLISLGRLASFLALEGEGWDALHAILSDFESHLTPEDRALRQAETQLRNYLFSPAEEDCDHRGGDVHFLFSTVCARMNVPLDNQPIGSAPTLMHRLNATHPYWGMFDHSDQVARSQCSIRECVEPVQAGWTRYCSAHMRRGDKRDPAYFIQEGGGPILPYARIGKGRPMNQVTRRFPHFQTYFHEVTRGLFDGFDFSDCCVAGGSLFQLLTGLGQSIGTLEDRRLILMTDQYTLQIRDLDFFLLTRNAELADRAVDRLFRAFYVWAKENALPYPMIVRTEYSLSIATGGLRIQVILRLYNSIAQVLSGFDLDSSTIAYNGLDLYCMDRFARMLREGSNLVDPERQSSTYVYRLIKYLRRGVSLVLPGYKAAFVTPTWLQLNAPKGLARLLKTWNNCFDFHRDTMNDQTRRTMRGDLNQGVAPDATRFTEQSDYGIGLAGDTGYRQVYGALYGLAVRLAKRRDPTIRGAGDVDVGLFGHGFYDSAAYDNAGQRLAVCPAEIGILTRHLSSTADEDDTAKLHYRLYQSVDDLFVDDRALFVPVRSTALEQRFTYRLRNPGGQATGSFQPTADDWLHDLYIVELDQTRYKQSLC